MVDHIDQANKQVDLEVQEHQDKLQLEELVILLLSVHLKEILGVREQVKEEEYQLQLVEVAVERLLLVQTVLLHHKLVEQVEQEHLILLLGLT
jgi:hypothetical protein